MRYIVSSLVYYERHEGGECELIIHYSIKIPLKKTTNINDVLI